MTTKGRKKGKYFSLHSMTLAACIAMIALAFGMTGCSDKIDESNLFVFTGESASDFIKSQPELSYYYTLLTKARSGMGKGSTMDHMLSSRGNYTCFVPVNSAVQHFLDSVYNQKDYDINAVSDSMAQVIVFNSIIDNGNVEAYKSTDFQEGVLQLKTMADRYIAINFVANDTGRVITRINTFSTIIMAVVNIFFDWALIFGNVGLPEMGIGGAALASLLAEITAFFFFWIYTYIKIPHEEYGMFRWHKWQPALMGDILKVALLPA